LGTLFYGCFDGTDQQNGFLKAATTLGLLYGIFMVIYLLATYIIFNMKYTYGRKKVKKYYAGLKKISAMYLREERLKGNGNKDWD
jgi:hypothetical protein